MKSQIEWERFWDAQSASETLSSRIIALFQEYAKNRSWLVSWFDNRTHVTTVREAIASLGTDPAQRPPQEIVNVLARALYDSGNEISLQGDLIRVFNVVLTKAGISAEAYGENELLEIGHSLQMIASHDEINLRNFVNIFEPMLYTNGEPCPLYPGAKVVATIFDEQVRTAAISPASLEGAPGEKAGMALLKQIKEKLSEQLRSLLQPPNNLCVLDKAIKEATKPPVAAIMAAAVGGTRRSRVSKALGKGARNALSAAGRKAKRAGKGVVSAAVGV